MKNILRNLYCVLAFAAPIFFNYFPEDPYEMNKISLVYLFTGIIAIIWTIKIWQEKKVTILKNKLALLILAFLFFNLISLIFSIHPYSSLVGNSYRFNGGIFSLASYIILFLIFIETFHNDKKILNDIIGSMLLASLFISLYGIYQLIQIKTLNTRITSTFGQPDYLGEYLAFVIPLNIYYFFREVFLNKKVGLALLLAINLVALLATGSRASWLALVIAMIIFGVIFSKTIIKRNKKTFLLAIILIIILILPFFNQIRSRINLYLFTETKNEELLQGGWSLRLFAWKGATQIFLHNPLTGTGPETMMYVMPQYIDKGINNHIEWGFRFDKAHNEFLDILANTGFFAFLFYILILITALKDSAFNHKAKEEQKVLGISLIAIIVANLFSFSPVAIALYFWLALALIIVGGENITKSLNISRKALVIPAVSLTLAILFFFYFWGKVYLASSAFIGGSLESAVKLNPHIDRYHGNLAIKLLNKGDIKGAIGETEKAIRANPLNADSYIVATIVYGSTADMQEKTLSAYDKATELEPTNPRFLLKKAEYLIKIEQKAQAKESLQKALELKFHYPEAKNVLEELDK